MQNQKLFYIRPPIGYNFVVFMEQTALSKYVKTMRKKYNLTQVDLSQKSGVGLRLVRELEQGKRTLRLDKVNQILNLFGSEVGVVPMTKRKLLFAAIFPNRFAPNFQTKSRHFSKRKQINGCITN